MKDKQNKFELVDIVALENENARLKRQVSTLNDIIDRAIIVLAEANPFYLATIVAAKMDIEKQKQEMLCCKCKGEKDENISC